MGLDMYLMKIKKSDILESETIRKLARDLYSKNDRNAILFEPFEKLGLTYTYKRWEFKEEPETYLDKEVAYWRKANSIHNWIYNNCAKEGQEDYEDIYVSKEKIEELINICGLVLQDLKTCGKGYTKIHTGWSGGQDTYETIEVYESIVAKQLLPTQSGFFFGSTEYTEYYKEDLEDTIRQLEQVLKETDFENEELYYYASY